MAIAIHVGKTDKMDYEFKYFYHKNWKFYGGYLWLANLPKFSNTSPCSSVTVNSISSDMSEQSAVDGGATSRGNGGGRGKAATERAKKAKEDNKRKRDIEKDKRMEEMSTNISDIGAVLKKKSRCSIIKSAPAVNVDPIVAATLKAKLFALAMEI